MTSRPTLPEMILEVLQDGTARRTWEIREEILKRFSTESHKEYHNDASISARTREMKNKDLLVDEKPKGKAFKVWAIKPRFSFEADGQMVMG